MPARQTFLRNIELMDSPHSVLLHTQAIRNNDILIEVVDERGRVINHPYALLHAKAEMGSITVSGDSHVRRTGQLSLKFITSLAKGVEEVFWMTNRIRIYAGIQDKMQVDPHYVYYLLGTYYVTTENVSLDPQAKRMNLSIQDLSAVLDRKQIEYELVLDPGTPVTTAVTMIVEDYLVDHNIVPSTNVIPHTMRFPIGTNVTDILNALRDLYMDNIFYFDLEGVFRFHRYDIQRPERMPVRWKFIPGRTDMRVAYAFSSNFQEVRNHVEIYGQMNETGAFPRSSAWIQNPESPFYKDRIDSNGRKFGERRRVIHDNSIRTNIQADSLARWTLFHQSQRQMMAEAQCVPIFYLDVLEIVEIPHETSNVYERYEVRNITFNLSHDQPMAFSARRVYGNQFDVESENQDHLEWIRNFRTGISERGWWYLGEQRAINLYNLQVTNHPTLTFNFEHAISERLFVVNGFTEWNRQSVMLNIRHFEVSTGEDGSGGYMMDANRVTARIATIACLQDHWGASRFREIPRWFRYGLGLNVSGARPYLRHILGDDYIEQGKLNGLINRCLGLFRGGVAGILSDNSLDDMAASFILTRFFGQNLLPERTLSHLIENLKYSNSSASMLMTDALLENMDLDTWQQIDNLLANSLSYFIRQQWSLDDPNIPGTPIPNVMSNAFNIELRGG